MLLLTATRDTQGQHPGDFCEAIEGELVVVFSDCHVDAHQDQLRCREGCPARFFGLNSHKATTTAKIRSVEISPDEFAAAIAGYAESRGSSASETVGYVLADLTIERGVELPGTVVGLTDGRQFVRASARPTLRGVLAMAGQIARSPGWHHGYTKRLREIDKRERAEEKR